MIIDDLEFLGPETKRSRRNGQRTEGAQYQAQSFVYFVSCKIRDFPIKIGVAADVRKRLNGLQTSIPYPLVLLAITPGSYDRERDMKIGFCLARMRGEWYCRHPELIEFINSIRREQKRLITPITLTRPPGMSDRDAHWLGCY